jgi:CheY-like chemotaxis protein
VVANYHRLLNCIVIAMTRVLLLEDSPDVLYLLQLELEYLGYEVDAAADAHEALRAAQQTRPDVIVSDLGMPGMDGFEFIKRVRKTPALCSVPAVALSGASRNDDIQRALASGFTCCLTKPVESGELSHRIEQLTARRLQRMAG